MNNCSLTLFIHELIAGVYHVDAFQSPRGKKTAKENGGEWPYSS